MQGDFLAQSVVYLTAAVVSVPISKRCGFGSVLGYLIAGAIIGPHVLGFVGSSEGEDVMHFAEFGVVMMLFLIGLELRPSLLWRLRGPILGLGGAQVVVTAAIAAGLAISFGASGREGMALGMILALSSTAIVLQTLAEKGLLKTPAGQSCFSVLLFQDIAVIPMFAILPLFAMPNSGASTLGDGGHGDVGWVASLPGWQQAAVVLGAVVFLVLVGRLLMRRVLRFIASAHLPEVFTAAALLLVVAIALLMSSVGLSPALGTFLAGVVLADSEYRHELEADIEPFKGLLLGLFFLSVGASLDFALMGDEPMRIAGLVAALVIGKLVVLLTLAKLVKMPRGEALLFGFALAQGGEFAFVLFSFAAQNDVLSNAIVAPWTAAVALSMAITPIAMIFQERVLQPMLAGSAERASREADVIDESAPVVMAGYGRFGHVVGLLLRARGVPVTVLDLDERQIEVLRRMGMKVFFGDATRVELLHAAGASQAKVFVCAVDDPDKSLQIVRAVRSHFPHLRVLARARGRPHGYELMRSGAHVVERETLGSSLELGAHALVELGVEPNQAWRAARRFRRHDEEYVREMVSLWGDEEAYFSRARARVGELERLFAQDFCSDHGLDAERAWEPAKPNVSDVGR